MEPLFNPAVARVFRHPPLAGEGGAFYRRPQSITREPIAAATRGRRQTKARDKTLPMICFNLNLPVYASRGQGQGQVTYLRSRYHMERTAVKP